MGFNINIFLIKIITVQQQFIQKQLLYGHVGCLLRRT